MGVLKAVEKIKIKTLNGRKKMSDRLRKVLKNYLKNGAKIFGLAWFVLPALAFGEDAVGRSEESHCWDQTGQTGDSFSDREGVQISAVHRMVTRLMGA